jgi:2',3'-cyclic-nucleotide 2'-phosphodiesterase (5'-nucleotidase family)
MEPPVTKAIPRFFPVLLLALGFLVPTTSWALEQADPSAQLSPVTSEEGIDEELAELLRPYREGVVHLEEPIGTVKEEMTFSRRHLEMGAWITDTIREYFNRELDTPVDLVIINRGGLRTTLHAGPVSRLDLMAIMPFDNTLGVIELSGEKMLELGEFLASRRGFNSISGGRILHDAENRLLRFDILGGDGEYHPVDKSRGYKVGTINFLATGGDGFTLLAEYPFACSGVILNAAMIHEVERLTTEEREVEVPGEWRRYYRIVPSNPFVAADGESTLEE